MNFSYHSRFLSDALLQTIDKYRIRALVPSESEATRLNYYLKLNESFRIEELPESLAPFNKTAYSYDMFRCLWHSTSQRLPNYEFGDVTLVPDTPTVVKSRPIREDKSNSNAVILPLETERHLLFPSDNCSYDEKLDQAVWRGACYQPHRKRFIEKCWGLNRLDIGDTARKQTDARYWRSRMSIREQQRYKIIISLEGNDVASNLKWAMHSNSVVLMPIPKYETWFCEGFLRPFEHYVPLLSNYSDIEDKLDWILDNPNPTKQIIENAHKFTSNFLDRKRQYALGGLVLDRYFNNALDY